MCFPRQYGSLKESYSAAGNSEEAAYECGAMLIGLKL